MNLTPKERERLTVFMAAELARRRKDRGVPLNHPETVAYISDWCFERAREGQNVVNIRKEASQLLSDEDVMDGIPEMVSIIQVEPVFPDGTKQVTVRDPIRPEKATDEVFPIKERKGSEETGDDDDESVEDQTETNNDT